MTDILLPICYLINYSLVPILDGDGFRVCQGDKRREHLHLIDASSSSPIKTEAPINNPVRLGQSLPLAALFKEHLIGKILFNILLSISIAVQFVMVIGRSGDMWNVIPIDIEFNSNRAWAWKDNQINRHFMAIVSPIVVRQLDPDNPEQNLVYLSNVLGSIDCVRIVPYTYDSSLIHSWDDQCQSSAHPETVKLAAGAPTFIGAKVDNIGTERLYGVSSSLIFGETRARVRFYKNGKPTQDYRAYLTDTVVPSGRTANAFSVFPAPKEPGEYEVVIDLIIEEVGEFPQPDRHTKRLSIIVE